METVRFDGAAASSVEIDACPRCRAFWFDTYESLKLTPRATLQLFAYIGEHTKGTAAAWPNMSQCPRCNAALKLVHDRQKAMPFQYWSCPASHGRFEPFVEFLREKEFIKPLTKEQMTELREKVQSVHCSNCGAPIDLAKESICRHCSAPLSLVDTKKLSELAKMANAPAKALILPAVRQEPKDLIDEALGAVGDWLRIWFR
jgi:Zn-finger nucleic acid-binding protein